ncbi:MAG TPA: arylamine N-acetyltransferase [Pyrinomonadaceae bacterium]|nr:arylamine N-acetyltransferase [Pyrinomonadaceae bacterium]
MNVERYLERIGAERRAVSPDALADLQRRHLLTVPFENLDIHWKWPIVLNVERFYEKIMGDRRGGFCYELNGLFNELLKSLGYETRLISARVFSGDRYGPEFDHAAIIVSFGDDEYLTDVGFGDFTARPLRLALEFEQEDDCGTLIIRAGQSEYLEVAKRGDDGWKRQYIFTDTARELDEFSEMCDFQQYSPESHFTKGRVCSLMTEGGRRTLTDSKFLVLQDGVRTEREVASEEDFEKILAEEFGILIQPVGA